MIYDYMFPYVVKTGSVVYEAKTYEQAVSIAHQKAREMSRTSYIYAYGKMKEKVKP